MMKREYLDKTGLAQVIEALGAKLEDNDIVPSFSLRRISGTLLGATIVIPSEVVWDNKRRQMLGIVKTEDYEFAYTQWPGYERWIDIETGKPVARRLFIARGYRGREYLAVWRDTDGADMIMTPIMKSQRLPNSILPFITGVKRKYIPFNAQPGIVYNNYNGMINLRLGKSDLSLDLNNTYAIVKGKLTPLSKCTLMLLAGTGGFTKFKIDYSKLALPDTNGCITIPSSWHSLPHTIFLLIKELQPNTDESGQITYGRLITLRTDKEGRRIFTMFSANVDEEKIAIPKLTDLKIVGNEIRGASQVQTWVRTGTNSKIWAWRKYNIPLEAKRLTKYRNFKASQNQRTVFVRIRNIKGRAVSDWLYLRLWRTSSTADWEISEVHSRVG